MFLSITWHQAFLKPYAVQDSHDDRLIIHLDFVRALAGFYFETGSEFDCVHRLDRFRSLNPNTYLLLEDRPKSKDQRS